MGVVLPALRIVGIETRAEIHEEPEALFLPFTVQKTSGPLTHLNEGDAQFMIQGDPYKLIFQYDDMFGTAVILNDMKDKDEVVALLQRHFSKLKNPNDFR